MKALSPENPLWLFALFVVAEGFYLSSSPLWWLWAVSAQTCLCVGGLMFKTWRLYALSLLGLMAIFTWPQSSLPQNMPSAVDCDSWVVRGRARLINHEGTQRLQMIQPTGSCHGFSQPLLAVTVILGKKTPWFLEGDKVRLNKLTLLNQSPLLSTFKVQSTTRFVNLSRAEKIQNRSALLLRARQWLSPHSLAFYKSLITADRSNLSRLDKIHFKQMGIAHLLAISGMHTGIFFLWIHLCLRLLCWFPGRWLKQGRHLPMIDLAALGLLLGFLWMIGLPVSAFRAWVMLAWWIIHKHWFHAQTPFFILTGTAVFILVLQPWSIGQISFQLSFLSVAGILYILPLLPTRSLKDKLKQKIGKFVLSSLIISSWLFILNFVIVVEITKEQSWLSPLFNLLHITLVASLILPTYLLGFFTSLISLTIGPSPLDFIVFQIIEWVSQAWAILLDLTALANQPFLFSSQLRLNGVSKLMVILSLLAGIAGLKRLKTQKLDRH